jgi:ATP-binding cassette subfamily B protein
MPFLVAKIIDVGMMNNDVPYTIRMGIITIVVAFASLLCGVISGKYAAKASSGFARNLRHDIFYKIQDFSFENIDKFSTSSLVTRLTTDITNIQMTYQMFVRVFVRAPIMLIFSLVMAIKINAQLSIVFTVAVPVLFVALIGIAYKAFPYFQSVFKKYDRLNCVVQENVNAVRVVKAFVRQKDEINKFHNISNEVYQQFTSAEKIVIWNSPIMQTVMYGSMVVLSLVGGKFIVYGQMQSGELTSLIMYTIMVLSSLMMVSMIFVMTLMATSAAKRIVEVLNEESSMTSPANAVKEVKDGSIVFENVSYGYNDAESKRVLKNINVDIKSGETIGIIGGTGSSKTTLVQLIPRLYDVKKGCVKVGGVDVRDYDLTTLRDEVAMVLQKNVLFSGTIADNIRWGDKNASDEEVKRVCSLAQADGFVSEFPDGYQTMLEQGGSNVSGGQKQRLCIARALLKKPKILILDDSTSAVDTKTDSLIRKAFREEIPNTTKIIIAQRVSSVEDADRIIVLDGGEIVGIGTAEELLKTNKIYQEVYYSQMKGVDEV